MANPNKLFPLVLTDKLQETRAYYVEELGCELVHELPSYIQVRFGSQDTAPELAFSTGMTPGFADEVGKFKTGLIVSIPTDNADTKHKTLSKRKASVTSEPADRPWGWRSFTTVDPNGVTLDFFHVLDQAAPADATG